MADLVALALPLGPALLEHIQRARDRGDAVCILDQRLSDRRQRDVEAILSPTRLIDDAGDVARPGRPVETGDGLVVLTSGSSGVPKAAILTWEAIAASAALSSRALAREGATCWYACLPPTHIGGFAVLARALCGEADVLYGSSDGIETGPDSGATHIAVVRTQLYRHDLSRYRVVLLGGAKPPEELASNVVTTWGMTETGSGVVYNGRALAGVDLAISDGEILVRSPTLLRAYRDGPAPLRTGPDGTPDWLPTGDGGTLCDGVLAVSGRLAFVINSGGEKIWPERLEESLSSIEGLLDVAIIGVADAEWGERVVALAVTTRRAEDILADMCAVAEETTGPWAKPKEVRLVPSIPRTTNGKVRRDVLSHTGLVE